MSVKDDLPEASNTERPEPSGELFSRDRSASATDQPVSGSEAPSPEHVEERSGSSETRDLDAGQSALAAQASAAESRATAARLADDWRCKCGRPSTKWPGEYCDAHHPIEGRPGPALKEGRYASQRQEPGPVPDDWRDRLFRMLWAEAERDEQALASLPPERLRSGRLRERLLGNVREMRTLAEEMRASRSVPGAGGDRPATYCAHMSEDWHLRVFTATAIKQVAPQITAEAIVEDADFRAALLDALRGLTDRGREVLLAVADAASEAAAESEQQRRERYERISAQFAGEDDDEDIDIVYDDSEDEL